MVTPYWQDSLYHMIEKHYAYTSSVKAENILHHWDRYKNQFKHIIPHEILQHLEQPIQENIPSKRKQQVAS